MEVLEAIKTRRSIRKYKSTPVDDKTLEQVLEAAQWAPSWANTQCWRFVVVREPTKRAELADTLRSARPGGTNAAAEAIRSAPVAIVACAEREKSGYYHGEALTDKGDWFMFDVALAMQNLVLAAHALGLGTVIIGGFDAPKVAKILGVPAGFCVVTMTPLGVPDHKGQVSPRKQLSGVLYQEKFAK